MLLFKRLEAERSAVASSEIGVDSHASLQPERTNEELLEELQDLVKAHGRTRKGVLGMYIGGLALYMVTLIGTMLAFFASPISGNFVPLLVSLLASVVFVVVGLYGALRLGRSFYRRSRARLEAIVPALAHRGEARALPDLLALMDMRYSGIMMWEESRPVFLQAIESLLARTTADQFQELSRQQMWDILMLLYFPDGRLREVTTDMAIRCGDSRTLEALKKLQRLCAFGVSTVKAPFMKWNPMLIYLKKEGVPLASEESKTLIDRAVIGLTARVEEMRRDAQLLRPSSQDQEQANRELVRASAPASLATPPEQLVRPVHTSDAEAELPNR